MSGLAILPSAEVGRQRLRLTLRHWWRWWALGALLALVASVGREHCSAAARREAAAVCEQSSRQAALARELRADRARLARLLEEEKQSVGGVEEVPDLVVLGTLSSAAREVQGQLQIKRLSVTKSPCPPGSPAAPAAVRTSVEGVVRDGTALSRFAAAVRSAGLFGEVTVKSPAAAAPAADGPLPYCIECVLQPRSVP